MDVTLEPIKVEERYEQGYSIPNAATATKSDMPIKETPVSIQVVPQEVLRDQQSQQLADVVENVSGIQPWHAYGGAYEAFIVRGFLQSAANYRNGIRIPLARFDLANVDHVEVLKGPSSMLYGQADPGGLINTVTKIPTESAQYSLEQRIGSYGHYRTEANASGPINDNASLRYRLDLSYLNSETFRELSDNQRFFVAPALSWSPTADTRFNLSFEHMDDAMVYDSGTPAVGEALADIPIERTFVQPGLQDQHENNLVDFNVTHRLNAQSRVNAGITAFENDKEWNEFYFFAILAPGDQTGDRYAWFGGEHLATYTAWLNLDGTFQTGAIEHRVLLGAEQNSTKLKASATDLFVDTINIYTFNPFESNVDTTPFETAAPGWISNVDNLVRAVYLQDQLTYRERLHLVAGLRYDGMERHLESAYYSPLTSETRSDSSLSPRLGVLYQTTPGMSVYGHYVRSFGPSFDYESATLFEPQTATEYEVGMKAELFGGRSLATLALFDLTKSNIPTPDPNNPVLTVAIGEANSRGVELDVQGRVTDAISLIGTYAYTSTEITKDYSGNQGNRLPYVPQHQGSVWLKYQFAGGSLSGLSLGSGVYAAAKRYGDAGNTYSDGAYARLDLFGAYRVPFGKSALIAQLNINNVTNTEYYNLRSRWSNLPAEPLTVMGSIRFEI